MNYDQMTAPCGLDCFNCPMYLANESKDLRTAISKNLGIPLEKAVCQGCRNENGTIAFLGMTEPCSVYQCIENKGLRLCCDCSDFPCDHLHPYADNASSFPHNTKVFNLCLIKKRGWKHGQKLRRKTLKTPILKENLVFSICSMFWE